MEPLLPEGAKHDKDRWSQYTGGECNTRGNQITGVTVKSSKFREMPMKEITKLSAFILLIIGTIGLLLNEFAFDWGRTATITFAVVNFIGLVTLAFIIWGGNETN